MDITEVQVKLIGNGDERLKASCTLVVDGEFVIRDVKVIEGTSGLFVAMPSRKLTDHCPRCRSKNHLRAQYCNNCGAKLAENRGAPRGGSGPGGMQQMHAEIAHPINSDCRQRLHEKVITAYQDALAEQGEGSPTHVRQHDEDVEDNAPAPVETQRQEVAAHATETPSSAARDNYRSSRSEESDHQEAAVHNDDFGAGLL